MIAKNTDTGWEEWLIGAELLKLSTQKARKDRCLTHKFKAHRLFGLLHGSVHSAMKVSVQRHNRRIAQEAKDNSWRDLEMRLTDHRADIPLGCCQEKQCIEYGLSLHPRRRNWEVEVDTCGWYHAHAARNPDFDWGQQWPISIRTESEGRYGRSRYPRHVHKITVESWGFVNYWGLQYHYRGTTVFIKHPYGYKWCIDHDNISFACVARVVWVCMSQTVTI